MKIEELLSKHPSGDKYYVVLRGKEVGIYETWSEAEMLVRHFPNNKQQLVYGVYESIKLLKETLEQRNAEEGLNDQELRALHECQRYWDESKIIEFPGLL